MLGAPLESSPEPCAHPSSHFLDGQESAFIGCLYKMFWLAVISNPENV